MRKKIALGSGFVLLFILGLGFFLLHQNTYQPSSRAKEASQSAESHKHYQLYTNGKDNNTAIIFYPGALVEPESYSLWAMDLAQGNVDVYVLDLPLNLAVIAPNAADSVIENTNYSQLILAGHSLGGVMASRYAATHEHVNGMIFLASYPDEKGSLVENNIPVLSITATNDHVLNLEAYNENKQYLPTNTTYLKIEGGNHSGFGDYGHQKGDGEATIPSVEQRKQINDSILKWLA